MNRKELEAMAELYGAKNPENNNPSGRDAYIEGFLAGRDAAVGPLEHVRQQALNAADHLTYDLLKDLGAEIKALGESENT